MTTTRFWTAFAATVVGIIVGSTLAFYIANAPRLGGAIGGVAAAGFYLWRSRTGRNLNNR